MTQVYPNQTEIHTQEEQQREMPENLPIQRRLQWRLNFTSDDSAQHFLRNPTTWRDSAVSEDRQEKQKNAGVALVRHKPRSAGTRSTSALPDRKEDPNWSSHSHLAPCPREAGLSGHLVKAT